VPAGGERLHVETSIVHTVSPASPLGRALVGHRVGDELQIDLPRGRVVSTITWVR